MTAPRYASAAMPRTFDLSTGTRLALDDAGDGSPVLLIHGLGGWGWQQVIPPLSRVHRVLAPWLRGFGGSEGPVPYSIEDLARDAAGVLAHADAGPAHVVGHSLGGMVAQALATDHPEVVRSLALVSTHSHSGRRAAAFAMAMARVSEVGGEAALAEPEVMERLEQVLGDAFPENGREILARRLVGRDGPRPAEAAAWRAAAGFSRRHRLHEISCPVLIVHGTTDATVPLVLAQMTSSALTSARFEALEGVGHSPQREAPDRLAALILEHAAASEAITAK